MMAGTQAIDLGGHCTLKGWQVDYTHLREATIDVTKQLSKNSGHTRILGKIKWPNLVQVPSSVCLG